MKKRGTVLLIDDQAVNLRILEKILEQDYEILCAMDGRQALQVLEQCGGRVAAVVLDLVMPEMDGYQFMEQLHLRSEYANIPVLVVASDPESENRALEAGAWDFISKPYQPRTVCLRLQNVIARSREELRTRLLHLSMHDPLTGLYNRSAFFREMQRTLQENPELNFSLIRLDIKRFGLINSLYGVAEGDNLLQHLAAAVRAAATQQQPSVFGRIEADIFCLCVPCRGSELKNCIARIQDELADYQAAYYIEPTFGVYEIEDSVVDAEAMYHRATLAGRACKNNYHNNGVCYFDEEMRRERARTQEIANEMQAALDGGQFVVYLQPKYDLQEKRIVGAEALVRWKHPEKGLISPDLYIPVFEQNGFITRLDSYMWEQVCLLLRRWLDAGLEPPPISVNLSRQDMYNPRLVRRLRALVEKYAIPTRLMPLELTETALVDDPDRLLRLLGRLHTSGFVLLLDDFGSGYSSLAALKDMPVDGLKLDMQFLARSKNAARGRQILQGIQSMADVLGLDTIVEGVETQAQADFLLDIGCRYVQGYRFGRPMPVPEFEALVFGR